MALIAIVDDSRLARLAAAAALKHAGFDVVELEPTGLHEVLEALKTRRPDLLLLDQVMPTFSGASLVRACFEDDVLSTLKVLMLTAHHDENLEHRMANLGVHTVLHKPIEPLELTEAVTRLLAD